MSKPQYLSTTELAERFGVTVATVRKWLRDAGITPASTVKETAGRGRPTFAYTITSIRPLAKEMGVTL